MTRSLSTVAVLFFIGLFQAQVQAFAPPRPASFSSATRIAAARPARAAALVLRMSEGDEEKPKVSADGTFYDDEMDTAPVKDGISDSMKARLMKEAATGLDSETAQPNVILYIILGVAVLAVAGGAGVFY